jgi:hypothetical protein
MLAVIVAAAVLAAVAVHQQHYKSLFNASRCTSSSCGSSSSSANTIELALAPHAVMTVKVYIEAEH